MARAELNPVFAQFRGSVGDLVFRHTASGVVVAPKGNPPSGPPSEAQAAYRVRFSQAAAYGRSVMANPEAKAFYDTLAQSRKQPVFSLTIADYFHAPTVEAVDISAYAGTAGDAIVLMAADDIGVVRVEVSLTDGDGAALETGEAVLDGWRWVYTAQATVPAGTAVRVTACAFDRPGEVGESVAHVMVPAYREGLCSSDGPLGAGSGARTALRPRQSAPFRDPSVRITDLAFPVSATAMGRSPHTVHPDDAKDCCDTSRR